MKNRMGISPLALAIFGVALTVIVAGVAYYLVDTPNTQSPQLAGSGSDDYFAYSCSQLRSLANAEAQYYGTVYQEIVASNLANFYLSLYIHNGCK